MIICSFIINDFVLLECSKYIFSLHRVPESLKNNDDALNKSSEKGTPIPNREEQDFETPKVPVADSQGDVITPSVYLR